MTLHGRIWPRADLARNVFSSISDYGWFCFLSDFFFFLFFGSVLTVLSGSLLISLISIPPIFYYFSFPPTLIFLIPLSTHTPTHTHTRFLIFPPPPLRCLIAYSFFYFQLCGHYFAILSALLPRPDLHVGGLNSVVLIGWLVYTPHGNHSSLKMSTLRLTGLTVRHNV